MIQQNRMNEPPSSSTTESVADDQEDNDLEDASTEQPSVLGQEGNSMTTAAIVSLELASDTDKSRADEPVPAYVRRAIGGDPGAFGELYRAHRRDVARLAARLIGPRGDLEDLIQEVFIQVFRSLSGFRGDSRFTTWLHRVTVNVALMHLRAKKSRPQLSHEEAQDSASPDDLSPLDGAARNERLRALYQILDSISEKKRTVFILHDIEGVSASEIGKLVGAPVLTVRTRLFYARREVYGAMAKNPALDAIAQELNLLTQASEGEP